MALCEARCMVVSMTPTMKSAKDTLNSKVRRPPQSAIKVGKMLLNVAMMNDPVGCYWVGNAAGVSSNRNFAV